MSITTAHDVSCWYAIHTNPRQETRAAENLRSWGVETFSPKIKVRRTNPYSGTITYVPNHLYPGYIFGHFHADSLLSKVHFTRGVHSVVSLAGVPIPVDDEIIAIIKARIGQDGFVQIGERLEYGDQVIVKDGRFKDLAGMFEKELEGSNRVQILITTISFQAHVHIDKELVKRVS
jgi:transcription elongation factor/antiterminator RfaH